LVTTIWPNEEHDVELPVDVKKMDQLTNSGAQSAIFVGHVTYDDTFNRLHTTYLCRWFRDFSGSHVEIRSCDSLRMPMDD
jgi:hypothetical protein